MKYTFTYCALAGLMAFWGFAEPALAQDDNTAIPKEIRGVWALPDCRKQEQMIVFGDGYVLKTSTDSVSLFSSAVTGKGQDYYILSINDQEQLAATTENDGIMEVGYPPSGGTLSPGKDWDDLELDQHEEYSRCLEISNPHHDSGFAAMASMGHVITACSDVNSPDCAPALFAAADANHNKKLDLKEMTAAGFMLAYITEAAESDSVPVARLDKAMETARAKIPALAKALLEQHDQDKSKSLTLDEIGDPVAVFAGMPEAGYFFDLMKKAQNLFPWLGRVAGK